MNKINFKAHNYEKFHDFKDIMIQAFGIGCSLCESDEIEYVYQNHPPIIGNLIKNQSKNLTDQEVDKLIAKPLEQWQAFDEQNANQMIPTFLCMNCFEIEKDKNEE
ncbi:hypothetical protein ELUMI_v1c06930 [Williamsoniiplasma luminosum]|uniref:Uncharacterized protein n=1 Tax=Williamsoniiplasma luminosum TaxID=214888 RepID=A0A2K8NU86_9MOLU|nr:hypothetical protein [Williamsoniiplasma luminosum]ATZ17415.1 hypothetical protein ELUMI_v1c06930 [Williamsoniiplasma luminosum]